jgi:hypothetical protein
MLRSLLRSWKKDFREGWPVPQSRFTLSHSLPYLQSAFHEVLYLLYFLGLIRHLKCHPSLIQTDFALHLPACAPRSILEKPSPFSSAIATSKEPVLGDFLSLSTRSHQMAQGLYGSLPQRLKDFTIIQEAQSAIGGRKSAGFRSQKPRTHSQIPYS